MSAQPALTNTPRPTRRQFTLAVAGAAVLCGGSIVSPAWAKDSALPVPTDLGGTATAAARQGEPLVLLMTLPGCPYCELVRRNYLLPMRATGLHAWQLDVTDRQTRVRDFEGASTTGNALARRWGATFTPTLLFLNPQGKEVAERMVGVPSPDFFGAYLDQAISKARAATVRIT